MMPDYDSVRALVRNLKDAGCSPRTIEEFLALDGEGEIDGQLKLLEKQRKRLLARVHLEEKRIDCLDYLSFQLSKKQKAAVRPPFPSNRRKELKYGKHHSE